MSSLEKAQSPDFIAKCKLWEGKDDHANFEEHVTPLLKQIAELEISGHEVEKMLMPLPPALITMGSDECSAEELQREVDDAQSKIDDAAAAVETAAGGRAQGHAKRKLAAANKILRTARERLAAIHVRGKRAKVDDTAPGSATTPAGMRRDGLGAGEEAFVGVRDLRGPGEMGAKGEQGQRGRIAVVRAVMMFPSLVLCLDGGTLAACLHLRGHKLTRPPRTKLPPMPPPTEMRLRPSACPSRMRVSKTWSHGSSTPPSSRCRRTSSRRSPKNSARVGR